MTEQHGGFPRREPHGGTLAGLALTALPAVANAETGSAESTERCFVDSRLDSDREWERFLAGQDPIWQRMPRTWYEGPFLGNGFVGAQVYCSARWARSQMLTCGSTSGTRN